MSDLIGDAFPLLMSDKARGRSRFLIDSMWSVIYMARIRGTNLVSLLSGNLVLCLLRESDCTIPFYFEHLRERLVKS